MFLEDSEIVEPLSELFKRLTLAASQKVLENALTLATGDWIGILRWFLSKDLDNKD